MTTTENLSPTEATDHLSIDFPDKPEGPISAAIIAGGIGCFALGVLTTLAEASTTIKEDWLQWDDGVGSLSGKTSVAVIIWLISWAILHVVYRDRPSESRRALTVSLILIGLGVIGTFPTFFQLFAPE